MTGRFVAVASLLLGLGAAAFLSSANAQSKPEPPTFLVNTASGHYVAVNSNDNWSGTARRPWATINHAAENAKAGDTIIVHGGHYVLRGQVRVRNSGQANAWITIVGYPGEKVILDAAQIPRSSLVRNGLDNGAFQIEDVAYVRVGNLTVINSHDAGFTVRDASHIDLINNSTQGTFSSGIAVWDTDHDDEKTRFIRVLGNSISKATTWDLAPADLPKIGEPPHEALSIGGAVDFEVAYNRIDDSDKEGIDIKETSTRGSVYHNAVHDVRRQGIYVDAWFGAIHNIEIESNVVYRCHGAGIALSVENGQSVADVDIHHNLIFDNDGSGLYFSRWGVDHLRRDIRIHNNTFYHNGYGAPKDGQTFYWMTGGLYLYSTNLRDIAIRNNIFSDNRGFQIGYSELYLNAFQSWGAAARAKNIQITGNLIDGPNAIDLPIESGGNPPDQVRIYAVSGERAIIGNPLFRNPGYQDFRPRRVSPPASVPGPVGVYRAKSYSRLWWKHDFPPNLLQVRFGRSN
jgi:hypothetical protein